MMSGGWSGSESGVRQAVRVSESATWCMCVSELVVRGVCVCFGRAQPGKQERGEGGEYGCGWRGDGWDVLGRCGGAVGGSPGHVDGCQES